MQAHEQSAAPTDQLRLVDAAYHLVGLLVYGTGQSGLVTALALFRLSRPMRFSSAISFRRVSPLISASILQADGWMNRRSYLIVFPLFVTLVVLGMVAGAFWVRQAPRKSWPRVSSGSPAQRLAFYRGVQALVLQANRRDPARLPKKFWLLLAAFGIAQILWVAAVVFRP